MLEGTEDEMYEVDPNPKIVHIDHDEEYYAQQIHGLIIAKIEGRAGTQYISVKELEFALDEAFGFKIGTTRILPNQRYK